MFHQRPKVCSSSATFLSSRFCTFTRSLEQRVFPSRYCTFVCCFSAYHDGVGALKDFLLIHAQCVRRCPPSRLDAAPTLFSWLSQTCSAITMMFRVDRTMMVPPNLEHPTTHACVFSRIGECTSGESACWICRQLSSQIDRLHLLSSEDVVTMISKPCGGVVALFVNDVNS